MRPQNYEISISDVALADDTYEGVKADAVLKLAKAMQEQLDREIMELICDYASAPTIRVRKRFKTIG